MVKIAPSILSADFGDLRREIKRVEDGGANLIHVDVMDGHFVPNITMGPVLVESLKRLTDLPLDVHLMIEEPIKFIPAFLKAGANHISVHCEADRHLNRTVRLIQEGGAKAGVAINPATSIREVEEIIFDTDFVLLMSVNPGFGGQKFIETCYEKIRKLKALILDTKATVEIEVDGGIGLENLHRVVETGADIIVSGSAIFGAMDPKLTVQEMCRILQAVT